MPSCVTLAHDPAEPNQRSHRGQTRASRGPAAPIASPERIASTLSSILAAATAAAPTWRDDCLASSNFLDAKQQSSTSKQLHFSEEGTDVESREEWPACVITLIGGRQQPSRLRARGYLPLSMAPRPRKALPSPPEPRLRTSPSPPEPRLRSKKGWGAGKGPFL